MDAIYKIEWVYEPCDEKYVKHVDLDRIVGLRGPYRTKDCIIIEMDMQLADKQVCFYGRGVFGSSESATEEMQRFHAQVYEPLLAAWQTRKKHLEKRSAPC